MRKRATNFSIVVATILLAVSTSLAHAKLVSSSPSAGESLQVAPSSVSLQFSVKVQSSMSSIAVKDASKGAVAVGAINESDQGKLISVPLPQLASGIYRVEWRALSADDHMIEGSFEFSVGAATQPEPAVPTEADHSGMDHSAHEPAPSINWPQSLVRWLLYIGMMLLGGGLGFRLLAIADEDSAISAEFDKQLARLFTGAASLIVIALLAGLALQTRMVTGSFGVSQAMSVLTATSFGPPWLLQLLAAVISFSLMLLPGSGQRLSRKAAFWIAFALSVVAMFGPSLTGHARAAWDEYSLAILSDWLHLVAGSMWIGGLGVIAFAIGKGLGEADRQAAQASLSATIQRFTSIAIPATVLLAITGLYNTWIHVESLSALVGTTYGFALMVKVAISGVMIVLGAINAFVLRPWLTTGSGPAADAGEKRLFSSVRFEMLLAMIVLLLAAILAFLPPAREHEPISASEAPAVQEAR